MTVKYSDMLLSLGFERMECHPTLGNIEVYAWGLSKDREAIMQYEHVLVTRRRSFYLFGFLLRDIPTKEEIEYLKKIYYCPNLRRYCHDHQH